jgi:uncharacterized membrane protein YbhN (UPF0104 family)
MKQYHKSIIAALICSGVIYFLICLRTNNWNWSVTDYLLLCCLYELMQINFDQKEN